MAGLYKKLFAYFYDSFMQKSERGLYKKRKALIEPLRGRIMEVGSGTGVNYQFYAADTHLFALDPNQHMLDKATKKAAAEHSITYLNHGICDEEVNNIVESQSLDAIVSTLVLCSVPDPELAIERFKRWLKPNGQLIILEHIHAENKFNRGLQNIINPFWRTFSNGCNLNRDTDLLLENAGFVPREARYFVQSLRFVSGIYVMKD